MPRRNVKPGASLKVRPGSMVSYNGRVWQVWSRADRPGYWWLACGGIYDQAHARDLKSAHMVDRHHS